MQPQAWIFIVEKYFLPTFFGAAAFIRLSSVDQLNLISVLNSFIKPVAIAIFLFFSTPSNRKFSWKVFIGIALSFIAPYLIEIKPTGNHNTFVGAAIFSAYAYITTIFFISLININKSFSVIPSFTTIKKSGMYSVVRHPIYSSYILFFTMSVLLSLNLTNVSLWLIFVTGLVIRAREEESFLIANDSSYLDYKTKTPAFFSPYLFIPVLVVAIGLYFSGDMNKKTTTKINIAYPVFFLNPVKADDWSSFFVINHIYPRFSAEIGEFRSSSILKNKKVSCEEDGKSILASSCKRVKVEIAIKNGIKMCNGQTYKLPNFINEFQQLTNHKNWLFPGYATCEPQEANTFCFSFNNDVNIDHVLRSIYLRFGWSLENADFGVRGVMPNCFYPKDVRDSIVYEGTISTAKHEIVLSTKDEDSDLILYGNKADDKRFKSLGYYNPIYYFLITSGEVEGFDLPWTQDSKMAKVQNLFELNKVTVKNYNADILTKDIKKNEGILKKNRIKTGLKLILPDYFANCAQLSNGLKEILDKDNVFKLSIPCSNISSFVDNTVKIAGKTWDAYITPLTPGLPGNSALQVQYFSPTSNESWLGKNSPEDSKVYLLGTTDGIVQTKPGTFCSVKPNALGLSDFTFDDLILCDN